MNVEWVGGPEDGTIFEVPDGTRNILISMLDKYCINPKSIDDLVIHQISISLIFKRGRCIAHYPYPNRKSHPRG